MQSCVSREINNSDAPLDYWNSSLEGDYTALIEACGDLITSGYAYCRRNDTESAKSDYVYFMAPPVTCKNPPCVHLKVFNSAGKLAHSISFRKGETRVGASWMTLIKKERFEVGDRGFWPFFYEITFTDQEGLERTIKTDGEIRLRVHAEGYFPLDKDPNDRFFKWEWSEDGQRIKMTTGGRTYVSPKGKE